jgi:hypothetical protein
MPWLLQCLDKLGTLLVALAHTHALARLRLSSPI